MSPALMMSSRELRRVPANFLELCPLNETWPGYLRPDELDPDACPTCGPASGYGYVGGGGDGLTPEARAIDQTFYPHQIGGPNAEKLAWCDKIGQAEVDNLLANGRLRTYLGQSLPTRTTKNGKRYGRHMWAPLPLTADEVNERQRRRGLPTHDAINRGILVKFRCEQLGIPFLCPTCDGEGTIWASPEAQAASEAWEPTEPPTGDHIVLWQTVSEGGPCSEVFPDTDRGRSGLAHWLAVNDTSIHRGLSAEDWLRLFNDVCPTIDVATGNLVTSDGAS